MARFVIGGGADDQIKTFPHEPVFHCMQGRPLSRDAAQSKRGSGVNGQPRRARACDRKVRAQDQHHYRQLCRQTGSSARLISARNLNNFLEYDPVLRSLHPCLGLFRPPGPQSSHSSRRLDVGVQPEQIGRIVLVLELHEARVVFAVSCAQALLVRGRLRVDVVALGERVERLPQIA